MAETNLSPHLPSVAGGRASVPSGGLLIIDTGLRNMRSCTASISATTLVPAFVEVERVTLVPGATQKIQLHVYDLAGGAAAAASIVEWIAIGD